MPPAFGDTLDQALDQVLAQLPADDAFTCALASPNLRGQVSAVVATYNRCPYGPDYASSRDNPLTWALESLLAQHGDALGEIVVIDDGSSDHTADVLDRYQQASCRVPVRVTEFGEHRGLSAARNAGIAAARGRWVLFTDDDCVCLPHHAGGAAHVLHRLQLADPATVAVMLPFYYRDRRPRQVVQLGRIGRLTIAEGRMSTCFHAWPDWYLPHPPLLSGSPVVAPLQVEVIGGTALVDAAALSRIGGFADLSAWRSGYAEHLYLSAALTEAGGRLYHCPDPRLAAVHLKFGAAGRFPIATPDLDVPLAGVGRSLGELTAVAAVPRADTGARLPDGEFLTEMIGGFFAFYATRSRSGACAWATRAWQEFVHDAQTYSRTVTDIPDHACRRAAWREGLTRAARVLAADPRDCLSRVEPWALLDEVCDTVGEPAISGS